MNASERPRTQPNSPPPQLESVLGGNPSRARISAAPAQQGKRGSRPLSGRDPRRCVVSDTPRGRPRTSTDGHLPAGLRRESGRGVTRPELLQRTDASAANRSGPRKPSAANTSRLPTIWPASIVNRRRGGRPSGGAHRAVSEGELTRPGRLPQTCRQPAEDLSNLPRILRNPETAALGTRQSDHGNLIRRAHPHPPPRPH